MAKPSDKSKHLKKIQFPELTKEFKNLKKNGNNPIDFSTLNQFSSTPGIVRNYAKRAIDKRKAEGYPVHDGNPEFKKSIANWIFTRFDVELDNKQICATQGAKDAVYKFAQAFLNPGDLVIVCNPGEEILEKASLLAGANVYKIPITEENNFIPDLEIPKDILKKAKIFWLNYPNNPTTAIANIEFFENVAKLCRDYDIILANYEVYSGVYYEEKPSSLLQAGFENIVIFNSLSHRSVMAMYRVGYVAGDQKIIEHFAKFKKEIDLGVPTFIQDAAIAAYSDENHADAVRGDFKAKLKIMTKALKEANIAFIEPKATPYIWIKCPEDRNSEEFCKKLLDQGILALPGKYFDEDKYVRLALTPSVDDCKLAAERLVKC